MAAFVVDTFTGANGTLLTAHTGETGATWTQHPASAGQMTINTNRVYLSTSGAVIASGTPPSADYAVEAVMVSRSQTGTNTGIIGRCDPTAATFYMFRWFSTTNVWDLQKAVAGTFTELDTAPATITDEQVITMRLEMAGTSIRGYVDDVLVVEATDSSITAAGRVGFRGSSVNGTTSGTHFDSITADRINAAPVVNAGADAVITTADPFTQDGSFTDDDGMSTSWTATVDYGEGAGQVPLTLDPDKTFTLSNTYEAAGVYTVTVRVTDDGSLVGADTVQVTVNAAAVSGQYIVVNVTGTDASAPTVTLI